MPTQQLAGRLAIALGVFRGAVLVFGFELGRGRLNVRFPRLGSEDGLSTVYWPFPLLSFRERAD